MQQQVEDALAKYGKAFVNNIKKNLKRDGKNASGKLSNSFDFNARTITDITSLKVTALDYYKYIEDGRRRGKMPPLTATRKWARKKGIDDSAVYPIARSIGKNGIKAKSYVKDFDKRTKQQRDRDIATALGDIIEDKVDESFDSKLPVK